MCKLKVKFPMFIRAYSASNNAATVQLSLLPTLPPGDPSSVLIKLSDRMVIFAGIMVWQIFVPRV